MRARARKPMAVPIVSERPYDRPSIFSRVDQAGMIERLEHSPRDDDEIGFLSDRDDSGQRQVAPSLMDGIRIFSGEPPLATHDAADTHSTAVPERTDTDAAPNVHDFILFGPAGRAGGATADVPDPLPCEGAS
jgi:hypothetical protein